jgi:hypothetical protein
MTLGNSMDLTMDKNVDPWNKDVKITPSPSLIQLFQDWNQTKSTVKKLCSFNRAKQWIALLLKRPVEIPNGHKMRLVDHLAAIDHMALAHQSGISHDDYLRSCLAPIAPIQTEAEIVADNVAKVDTNVKVVITDDVEKTEESIQVPEGTQSPSDGNEGNVYQPVCGSMWKGVACETTNCPKTHLSRCKDLQNCLVLDQGLPRYKILQCQNWHAEPRSKKKKKPKKEVIPNPRTSHPRVKKPVPRHVNMHVDEWPPLPTRSGPSRSGPPTSKRTRDSSPQVTAPVHSVTYNNRTPPWSKPVDPFPKPFSTYHSGNESAAWSTPSLGGSQTTWEAMIRSDPSQKFNLAMELVKMISQL